MLERFRCLKNEAINYEKKALHISAHIFFERTELQQKWQGIRKKIAFNTGHNKKAPEIGLIINNKQEVLTTLGDEKLRKKLTKIKSEILKKQWSSKKLKEFRDRCLCVVVALIILSRTKQSG